MLPSSEFGLCDEILVVHSSNLRRGKRVDLLLEAAARVRLHDEPRRRALGRSAQARARACFSAEVIVLRYEALYRRLCR